MAAYGESREEALARVKAIALETPGAMAEQGTLIADAIMFSAAA